MEDIKKFSEMDITKEIKQAISKMGFEEATPIQKEAIPIVMEGHDFIGIAQTGTGKTCAFGIPVIQKVKIDSDNVQILILCPTRELVIQTGEELQELAAFTKGVKITTIYGGQSIDKQIISLRKKPQIVIGTPGRIMDHMRRKTLKFDFIEMLVLDEADEMLNMGFREDLDVILEKASDKRQTMLFSATMSKDILRITKKYLKNDVKTVEIAHKTLTAPKIKQYMVGVQDNKKLEVLSRILDAEDINLSVIFCNTKRKVDELVDHLKVRGYQVDAIHGDMKQSQRDIVMRKFRTGRINILIATDVAARGIDVENVEVIFNYDIPSDEEYYVHRIGRTGRAGKDGRAITFVTSREMYKLKSIQKYTNVVLDNYVVPTAKFLNEKKVNAVLEKITKEIDIADLAEEISIIEGYLQNVEVSLLDITAALLKMKLGKTKVEEIEFSDKVSLDRVRLFMTIGKMDGLRRNELKDYVVKAAGIARDSIFDTEVLDKFSFVTVSEDTAKQIITKLDNTKYNNRKLAVEISTGAGSNKSSSRRPRK